MPTGHLNQDTLGRMAAYLKIISENEEADPDAMIEAADPDATAETTNMTTLATVADPVAPVETINFSNLAAVDDVTDTMIQEAPVQAVIEDDGSAVDPVVAPAETITFSTLVL